MRQRMTITALVCMMLLSVPAAAAPVTINVTGGDVRTVLLAVARMGNLPLIVDDRVDGTVTAHLTGADARGENRRVHTYVVRFADPEELAHAANLSLTGEGKRAIVSKNNDERENEGSDSDSDAQQRVLVDTATNTLLFYGTESEALAVREIISALDREPQQVSLEARVVAVSKEAAKQLGVDWSWSSLPQYPRAQYDGNIVARVHTEVSTPVYVEDLKAYRFQKRSADTTVRLKNGETMVIGGLIDSDESRSLSKIPFLGDLPVLGAFFRSVRTSRTETELMIFLTAHVLDET